MGSFFVVQGASMDRVMFGGRFVIPSASLALFNTISIIVLIPIYDRGVVPLLRLFGTKLSHLQRIGEQHIPKQRISRRHLSGHRHASFRAFDSAID
jgi:hypothetical protein